MRSLIVILTLFIADNSISYDGCLNCVSTNSLETLPPSVSTTMKDTVTDLGYMAICSAARNANADPYDYENGENRSRFEEALITAANNKLNLGSPKEVRVQTVKKFWDENYGKIVCESNAVFPEGGLLRQVAFSCTNTFFPMLYPGDEPGMGYPIDILIKEKDGKNIKEWMEDLLTRYAQNDPEAKKIFGIKRRYDCFVKFKADLDKYLSYKASQMSGK